MALLIDASSPAIATASPGPTVTTGSFTPPAGSLLLVLYAGDTVGGHNPAAPSITDNLGAHLTYTLTDFKSHASGALADGQAAGWTALVGSSAAMTVSVTNNDSASREGALKVYVLTGQHATPVGAHGPGGSISASSIAQSYTASATGGQGFIGVCDWDTLGAETAGTGCTRDGSANVASAITYGFLRRTTADDVNGNSNTLNVTIPGTSTNLSWIYVEIVPAASATVAFPPVQPERRRFALPRIVRSRSSTPVRAQVNPPFPFIQVTQPRRERGIPPRRVHAVTPVPPQFNPPYPYRAAVQPRRLRGLLPRRPDSVTPVPAQVIVTPAAYVIANVRARIRGAMLRRRGQSAVPAPQAVPPSRETPRPRPLLVRHVHTFVPPPTTVVVPPAFPPSRIGRRVKAATIRRGHAFVAPQAQQAPTLVERIRLRLPRIVGGRSAQVVPQQVILIAPTYTPQALRAKTRQWSLRRRRTGVDGWLISEHSCVTPRPGVGTTARPGTGVTTKVSATTLRPGPGSTLRPDTGVTDNPC